MTKRKDEASRHASALSKLGAAKGGEARARSLSPAQRSEIARRAAVARWGGTGGIPVETHGGVLRIAGRELPCYVLDNGLRVFSTIGLSRAVGYKKTGVSKTGDGASPKLPLFLAAQALRPFIPNDLLTLLLSPIRFALQRSQFEALGYEASLLPRICAVILDADKAGALGKGQHRRMVEAADILLRGFATVGIIALVDEATGYQADRARDELNKILEAYIAPELLPWTQKFPNEFFRQVYRLEGWQFKEGSHKRPRLVGKIINRYIYEPLPPGVLDELRRLNPPDEKGYRRYRHHQFLTDDIGHPHLEKQIIEVTTLMRVADTKRDFEALFGKAFPKRNQQLVLELLPANEEKEKGPAPERRPKASRILPPVALNNRGGDKEVLVADNGGGQLGSEDLALSQRAESGDNSAGGQVAEGIPVTGPDTRPVSGSTEGSERRGDETR